jgi:hypothetical protein
LHCQGGGGGGEGREKEDVTTMGITSYAKEGVVIEPDICYCIYAFKD